MPYNLTIFNCRVNNIKKLMKISLCRTGDKKITGYGIAAKISVKISG
jgi:hypothetical protein